MLVSNHLASRWQMVSKIIGRYMVDKYFERWNVSKIFGKYRRQNAPHTNND